MEIKLRRNINIILKLLGYSGKHEVMEKILASTYFLSMITMIRTLPYRKRSKVLLAIENSTSSRDKMGIILSHVSPKIVEESVSNAAQEVIKEFLQRNNISLSHDQQKGIMMVLN